MKYLIGHASSGSQVPHLNGVLGRVLANHIAARHKLSFVDEQNVLHLKQSKSGIN